MIGTDEHCNSHSHSGTPTWGDDPVPQPVFQHPAGSGEGHRYSPAPMPHPPSQGEGACSHLPAVVFVQFDGYSGPETPAWEGISPSWVPIVPAVAQWETKGRKSPNMYPVSS